ncbi:U32 family peptidase [Alcaligenaceae bacterium SJ-26]|nr:U32 family peptidase [Alcaligenaceae bacterium SJ-26]
MMFRIALGPLQYYWSRQSVFDFYQAVAEGPADIVYVGETVCSRRHELRAADWIDVADMLAQAGKTAVLSTQTLIETGSDAQALRKLCAQQDWLVEANEVGAVRHLQGRAFVAGPYMNAYHGDTLAWLHGLGAVRYVMPLENDRESLRLLLQETPTGLETEVAVWGRLPLAFSARCFTARHFRLRKDDCGFRCIEHPDGLLMETRESQQFLAINGIQTQSAGCMDILDQAAVLARMGVSVLRVSPQSRGTFEAVAALDAMRRGSTPAQALAAGIPLPEGMERCNGYWYGRAGIEWVEPAANEVNVAREA